MARPAEKARAMLNKWVKMREEGNAPAVNVRGKRPKLASECEHLGDAEFYRNQINREITGMIDKIQNPALGEHTIRDLNDEINRKFREKWYADHHTCCQLLPWHWLVPGDASRRWHVYTV